MLGDAWRGIVWREGGRGVRITRFLMTNDDVLRGRFVDRRGIERVSWYWMICFFFFFFEEKGEELSVIRMAIR